MSFRRIFLTGLLAAIFATPSQAERPNFADTFAVFDDCRVTAIYSIDQERVSVSVKREQGHASAVFLSKLLRKGEYEAVNQPLDARNTFTSPGTIEITLSNGGTQIIWRFFGNGYADCTRGKERFLLKGSSLNAQFFLELLEVLDIKSNEEVRKSLNDPNDPFGK